MQSSDTVTASAPGKLILCGEHAVVYGRPALVAAADLRLTARLSVPAGGDSRAGEDAPVRLSVPVLDLRSETTWGEIHRYAEASRRRWRRWADDRGQADRPAHPFSTVRADARDHLLKVALGEAAAALGESAGPPLDVHIDSELPTGSGFGSSAAAAVALVAAYLELRGGGPAGDGPEGGPDLALIERLALEVERRQHGSPSGVDGATVLHGGVVWAEPDAAGDLRFQPFDPAGAAPLPGLAVYDTGRPAEGTGTVVAEVRQGWRRQTARYEALWDEMEAATRGFRSILEEGGDDGGPALGDVIRRSQRALEEIGVVPSAVRTLVRTVEEAGGAAKISGAGSLAGPGAGTLLVHHPEPAALDELPTLSILPRFPVRLGGPGLRLDPVPQETP